MKSSRVAGAIVVFAALAAALWWWRGPVASSRPPTNPSAKPVARETPPAPPAESTTPAGADRAATSLADPAAFAELNAKSGSALTDLKIVTALLQNYQESVKSPTAPPMGHNEEIVRALTGTNPLGVAFLPASHPSINAAGLWCDRWGTPYLFHPLSAALMEVRSAGPDRKLFTVDDVVLRPPGADEVLR